MIRIDIFRNNKDMIVAYKVDGHAGYGEEGNDIVCSAVSMITQAPIYGLKYHLKCEFEQKVDQENGAFSISLRCEPNEVTQGIFVTMLYGLQSIERQYSKYVRIKEHRR